VSGVTTPEGTIEYEHNDYGELTRIKSTSGVDVTYLYDALGNLKVVKSKGFSASGDANQIVAYSYDSIGGRTGIAKPNGTTVSYTYDYRGNVDTITHEKDTTELLFLDYARDGLGLVTGLLERRQGESDVTWTYAYDAQKRLDGATRAVEGGGTTTYDYVYDPACNRTQKTVNGSTTTYTYNSLDQLIGDGTTTYVYDEFGNLKYEKQSGTVKRQYFWDCENRLTKVDLYSPDHTIVFGYDDNGTRISRKYDDDPATRYLTDYYNLSGYSQTLSELDESYTKVSRNYFYGQELLTQRTPGEGLDYLDPENPANDHLSFFHSDHLGSTRLLTDSDGSAISNSAFNYSPYGDLLSGSSSLTSYHFTGQYLDTAVSLQYHRARWLSTSLASWLSADPVFDFPGNFGNPYACAGLNPVNNTDLAGTFLTESLAVASIVAGLTTIDLAVGINLLYTQGGEAAYAASYIIQVLKEVGSFALYFVPVIGTILAVAQLPQLIADALNLVTAIVPRDEGAILKAVAFGVALVIVASVLIPGVRNAIRALADDIIRRINVIRYKKIGSTGIIGEKWLARLGGEPNYYFPSVKRYVDRLVKRIAHESKVGRVSLTRGPEGTMTQALKDYELLQRGEVDAVIWHFWTSPVTGKGGPTGPLKAFLENHRIVIMMH
jgi:RHS repeat-associated protein